MGSEPRIEVDISEERIWCDGLPVPVRKKSFALLRLFLENPGRLLTRERIQHEVWVGTHVSEASVKDGVRILRRLLDDRADAPEFIETVRGRGYRYLGGIALRDTKLSPGANASIDGAAPGRPAMLSLDVDRSPSQADKAEIMAEGHPDREMQEMFGRLVDAYGGSVFGEQRSGGLLAIFPGVEDAIRAGTAIHRAKYGSSGKPRLDAPSLRIGISVLGSSTGLCEAKDAADEARQTRMWAEPGDTLMTRPAAKAIEPFPEFAVEDLGEKSLRNIDPPVRTFRLTAQTGSGASCRENRTTPTTEVFTGPRRPSLAILPFRDLSGDPEDGFLVEGIALGIHTLLVRLPGLFFINACSFESYRKGELSSAGAGRKLEVDYVLEGAVERSGDRVRVSAQLTGTTDGRALWAERYDRTLEDVFGLQDDVAREVIGSLIGEIHGGNLDQIWTRGFTHPHAWEHYLRGINHFYSFTPKDNQIAREHFEVLHRLHPEKSIGKSYVALAHWIDSARLWGPDPAGSRDEAKVWSKMALASRQDNMGLGHSILGSIRVLEGAHAEGLRLCRQAIEFRANCPFALGQLAFAETYFGLPERAVKSARDALAVRLLYPPPIVNILATAYRDSFQISRSIMAAEEAIRLSPGHADAYATLCTSQALNGDIEGARGTARHLLRIHPGFRVAEFLGTQPYRQPESLAMVAKAFQRAGLG